MKYAVSTRTHWAMLIVLTVVFVFVSFFTSVDLVRAVTYCPYDSTQATCECPTSGPGVTCIEPQLYAQGSCYNDVRPCASNQRMNCDTGSCVCNTPDYPCSGCTAAQTTVGAICDHRSTDAGDCADSSEYTSQCGAWTCPAGTTLCNSPAPGVCVPNRTCPPGMTWDVCSDTCSTYYVLTNPTPEVSPQPANPEIEGNFTVFGDDAGEGDIYMSNGKALRVDGTGSTTLNIGNWGGGGFSFEAFGSLKADDITTDTGNIDSTTGTLNLGGGASSSGCTVTTAGDYSCSGDFVEAGAPLSNKYLAYDSYVQSNNPFSPKGKFFIPEINNGFFRGESRFAVNHTGFDHFCSTNYLFDNNYESGCIIGTGGGPAVVTIDLTAKTEFSPTSGIVYPQGYIYFNINYTFGIQSVSGRMFWSHPSNGTSGWVTLSAEDVSAASQLQQWRMTVPAVVNYVKKFEFTIEALPTAPSPPNPQHNGWITEIEYFQTRPAGAAPSLFTKYKENRTYSNFYLNDAANSPVVTLDTSGNIDAEGDIGVGDALCLRGDCITDWMDGFTPGSSSGDTLRWNGTDWIASSNLTNTGTRVGIGTDTPAGALDVHPGGAQTAGDLVVDTTGKTVYVGRISTTGGDNSNFVFRDRLGNARFTLSPGMHRWNPEVGHIMLMPSSSYGVAVGAANAGTAKLYVNGSLGVNTSSPAYDVDIDGDVRITGQLIVEGGGVIGGSGTANTIPKFTAGSIIGNSAITESGGNVGIGDVSPATILDLNNTYGDPGTVPNKIALWYGGANNYMGFGVSGGDLDYFSQGNHRFYTQYNGTPGTEKMVIADNGNVGIGTSSPVLKLQVTGDIQASDGIGFGGLSPGYVLGGRPFSMAGRSPQEDAGAAVLFGSGAYGPNYIELMRQSYGILSNSHIYTTANIYSYGHTYLGDAATDTVFWRSANSYIYNDHNFRDAVTGSTMLYLDNDTQYVGVNTTTPTRTLSVAGDIAVGSNQYITEYGASLRVGNPSGYVSITPQNTSYAHFYTDRPKFIFNKPIDVIGGRYGSYTGNVILSAGSIRDDLVIDNATGVTTINNGLRLPTGAVAGHALVSDASGNATWQALSGIGGGGTQNYLPKFSAATTLADSQVYDNGSNVGIGTATPEYKLDVNGDIVNRGRLYQYTQLGSSNAAHGISWYQPSYVTWIDYMAAPGTVNAPNGTPAPADSDNGVTHWARRFNIENQANFGWVFESGTNNATQPSVKLSINAASGNLHTVGSGYFDDNVGVGTTTPSAPLHVASADSANPGIQVGDGSTGRIQIGVNGWFDDGTYFSPIGGRSLYVRSTTPATYIYSPNIFLGSTTGQYVRVRDNQLFGDDWVINNGFGGNWGIGTITPAYTLDVNGTVRVTDSLIIDGSNAITDPDDTKNTMLGYNAGQNITTGWGVTLIGEYAGAEHTTAYANTFVGYQSGESVSGVGNATSNVVMGFRAGRWLTGSENTLIGTEAGAGYNAGSCCDYVGGENSGSENTFVGIFAGNRNSTGSYNVGLGKHAGYYNTVGNLNTYLGYQAGLYHQGSQNIIIGGDAGAQTSGDSSTGNNLILIGYGIQPRTTAVSDYLNIGDTLYGDLAAGRIGIGTAAPARALDLSSSGQITFGNNVTLDSTAGIYWYSGSDYGIYRGAGAWSSPDYRQLYMKWSTGLVLDGGSAYGKSGTTIQPGAGNVGIGTYPSAYKLDVNGQVNGTELCIAGDCRSVWPGAGATSGSGVQYGTTVWSGGSTLTSVGTGQPGQLYISKGASAYPEFVTMSGDATISSTGVVTVANGSHTHSAANITSGILAVARGGTGSSTLSNLITLGTHTTGNYVNDITAGTGITVSGVAGEGWSPTLAVDEGALTLGNIGGSLSLGTKTSGDYVASLIAGSGVTITGGTGEGSTPTISVSGGAVPSGPAGGDLNGNYPNPQVDNNSHTHISSNITGSAAGQFMVSNSSNVPTWVSMSGDASMNSAGSVTVSNNSHVHTLGSYTTGDYVEGLVAGSGISITGSGGEGSLPVITATGAPPSGSAGGDLSGSYPNPQVNNNSHYHVDSNIYGGASGQVLIADNSGYGDWRTVGGDASINYVGTLTINSNAVDLGGNTTGDYVKGLQAGSGISISGSGGEGSSPIISSTISSPWSVSGSNVYRSSGMVGILDSSPSYPLDVNGIIRSTSSIYGNYGSFTTGLSAGTESLFLVTDSSGRVDVNGTFCINSSCRTTWPSASSPWTTSGSNVYRSSGNVGIGTSAPSYNLDVSGTGRFTGTVSTGGASVSSSYGIRAQGSTMGGYFNDTDGTYVYIGYGTSGIYTPGGAYFGGPVGINTSSPVGDFQVIGDANVSGSLFGNFVYGNSASFSGTVEGDDFFSPGNAAFGGATASTSYGLKAQGSTMGGWFYDEGGTSRTYLAYGGYGVYVSTGSAAKPGGGSWTSTSDRRTKKDISSFNGGLDLVDQLNPVNYTYNGLAETPEGLEGIGFIAQDIMDVTPWMVESNSIKLHPEDEEESDVYYVNPSSLPFINLNAIKDLKALIDDENAELASFKIDTDGRMVEVEAAVRKLEEENVELKAKTEELEQRLQQLEWQMLSN